LRREHRRVDVVNLDPETLGDRDRVRAGDATPSMSAGRSPASASALTAASMLRSSVDIVGSLPIPVVLGRADDDRLVADHEAAFAGAKTRRCTPDDLVLDSLSSVGVAVRRPRTPSQ